MSELRRLTDEDISHAAEMVEIIHPVVLGENLRDDLLTICAELAALRARHEKLRAGCKALVSKWSVEQDGPMDEMEYQRHECAEELKNALLEDE